MMRTHVTSLINKEKFFINKGQDNELYENEHIYVLSAQGLVHASIIEIFEDQFICKAEKEGEVKVNDIVITE